jgi:hypothetical protein
MEDPFIFFHIIFQVWKFPIYFSLLLFSPIYFVSFYLCFLPFPFSFPLPTYPFGLAHLSSRTSSTYNPDVPFFPHRAQTEARVKLFAKNPN